MRFLLLLTESDPDAWGRATEAERAAVMEAHAAFDATCRERGALLAGEALEESSAAHTLRTVDGRRMVTEGPYAETVEQLGGVYLIEVDSLATAVELAKLLPRGYTIELRPAVEIEGYDYGDRH